MTNTIESPTEKRTSEFPQRSVGVKVDLELTIAGPILVTDSESGPSGLDAVCMRDSIGRLVIPGTLLKGLYRESLENLGLDPWNESESRYRN